MKNEAYAILHQTKTDLFQTIFKTKEEAIREAKYKWEKLLTKEEKRKCDYYAVVKGELDENGYIDFENVTKIIIEFKKWENQ